MRGVVISIQRFEEISRDVASRPPNLLLFTWGCQHRELLSLSLPFSFSHFLSISLRPAAHTVYGRFQIPFIFLGALFPRRPLCSRWSFNHRTIANDGRQPSGERDEVYLKRSSFCSRATLWQELSRERGVGGGKRRVFWPLSLPIGGSVKPLVKRLL